ncbi:MAG: ATP--guanido phosphotransferase [Christensenellaceae bacterium]|nr:ATP--guanido phosphotransferase [Christensenellaceae bacterium]
MSDNSIVISSRVRLARNYDDLPFDVAQRPEYAAMCIARTTNALNIAGAGDGFNLIRLRDLTDNERRSLEESRLVSHDLLGTPDTAAVMVRENEAVSLMMNEDDHLRIQAVRPGLDLLSAAAACFRVDDALSRQVVFAFDEQLGYLTACPTNTGTGMRASLLMHLPMLTLLKQMGNVGQIVAKVGLTIRGVYGEGSEALGNIYQVSNQVTLGRTEQEIISTVSAVGHQLTDMELSLREKSLHSTRAQLEDSVFRAWGILKHARLLSLNEFFKHWSGIRLGAAMGLLSVSTDTLDAMLDQMQDAHLRAYAEKPLEGTALDELRAARVRRMLSRR